MAGLVAAHDVTTHSRAENLLAHANLLSRRSLCARRDLSCVLAAEVTEGPFYIVDPLVRSDIAEDRVGESLALDIQVVDVASCEPVPLVWVDIWHADAEGEYSGWSTGASIDPLPVISSPSPSSSTSSSEVDWSEVDVEHALQLVKRGTPVVDSRWLRGVQRTDGDGRVHFTSIVPGWYEGRCDHIHIRIHAANTTFAHDDGHLLGASGAVSHTGQLFFQDTFISDLADPERGVAPYNTRTLRPKLNDEDFLFREGRGAEQLVDITPRSSGGFEGTIVVGIDPSAVRKPERDHRGGGGGGGPPPPPRGPHRPHFEFGDGTTVLILLVVVVIAGATVKYVRSTRRRGYTPVPSERES